MSKIGEKIVQRADALKSKRANWEKLWEDVGFFCFPRKKDVLTQRTPGEELPNDRYHDEGINSLNIFASGMNTLLTNRSSRWMRLRMRNKAYNDINSVKLWLDDVTNILEDILNASNFYEEVFENYKEGGCFGTSTLYEEEDDETIVRFSQRHIKEILIETDAFKRVVAVYRVYKLTALQAFTKFGDKCSKEIKDALENNNVNSEFEFVHCIEERGVRDVKKKDNVNMPFSSIHVDRKTKEILLESGFHEMPFFVVRLEKNDDEEYGFSPAMNVLAALRMLNSEKETFIRSAQMNSAPPMDVPYNGYSLPLDFNPNGINFRKNTNSGDTIKPILTGGNTNVNADAMNMESQIIKNAFFTDIFLALTLQTKQMTVPEVMQRVQEKMLVLGPIVGRIINELLKPTIERTFGIIYRKGLLPEPPQEIQGMDLEIEYISPLARSQKLEEIKSIDNVIAFVGSMAQLNPNVLDKMNFDEAVEEVAGLYGINPKILHDDKTVESIRQARQEAQMAAQKQEQMMAASEMAEKVGKTGKDLASVA